MSQAGSGGGLNVFWLAYRTIRAQFDKCTKRCGAYELNTSRRQHCMIKCKEAKARAELAAAKKANDEKRIKKAAKDLQKVQALLKKSTASFTKRGADI
jgi:multidrug resistance efflux pump